MPPSKTKMKPVKAWALVYEDGKIHADLMGSPTIGNHPDMVEAKRQMDHNRATFRIVPVQILELPKVKKKKV